MHLKGGPPGARVPFGGGGGGGVEADAAAAAAAAISMDDGSDNDKPKSCRPPGAVQTPTWLQERERNYAGGADRAADGWR